jgi:predicted PurR-regulated permease PerM
MIAAMQRGTIQKRWTLLLLALVTLAFAAVVRPYLGAIFWGVVLAVVFEPLHAFLLVRFGGRRTAAALATMAIAVAGVGLPMVFVAARVARQAAGLYDALVSGRIDISAFLQRAADAMPEWFYGALEPFGIADPGALQGRLASLVVEAARFIASHLLRIGLGSVGFAISTGVMLYLLFFLLRDGRPLAARIEAAIPLARGDKQSLLATFVVVIRATVKGGIVMAIVQGVLGGLVLAGLGIPAPMLWAAVFGLTSMLPAVGAGLVWVPVALYFLLVGSVAKALWLTFFGSVVLTVIDNVLRPILVGHDAHLPGYAVLISTLGGVAVFGLSGVVIGPVVAALFVATWALFAPPEAAATPTRRRSKKAAPDRAADAP